MISSLDNDAYVLLLTNDVQAVVASGVQCLIVQSSSYSLPENNETTVIRPSKGSGCAIVDRSTKDLKDAATRIAQAKFAYGGISPFAPEFVLVHEVVKSEFLRELFAAISQYFPDNIPVKDQEEFARLAYVQNQLTSSKTGYGRVIMSGNGSGSDSQSVAPVVIEGDRRRGTELYRLVGNTPMLPIFSTRSLDDAINYSTTLYVLVLTL
jgi:aldehyde dehydrogenase (NAD+)